MVKSENTYMKHNLVLYTNPDFEDVNQSKAKKGLPTSFVHKVNAFQDIDYDKLNYFKHDDFLGNKVYVCEMFNRSSYKHLEYVEISHYIADKIFINAEVNFRMSQWNARMNVFAFVDSLIAEVNEKYSIQVQQENLYDEDLIHLKFRMLETSDSHLPTVIQQFADKLNRLHKQLLSESLEVSNSANFNQAVNLDLIQ